MCEKELKRRSCTECPQYDGLECRDSTPIVADSADLKEVTVSPPMPEHEVSVMFSLDEGTKTQFSTLPGPGEYNADMLRKGEGGPFTNVFTGAKMPDGIIHMVDCNPAHAQFQYRPEALPKYAGSPSSECPSRREGPPQKGKIDENNPSDAPSIPSGTIVAGEGIQVIENPGPMWKDTNGYWEPVKLRSCTNCKLYNDPICMKIGTHIGTRAQIWQREDLDGFQCIAALPKEERMSFITSTGCNNRKEIC